MIQATPKTLSMYTQHSKNLVELWEKMHQHRYHIKLTKDYEETEGTQMLKDPKETSPTLLFFLSVFHNIAATFHPRNTSHAFSHLSTE